MEERIVKVLGFPASVISRNADEMSKMIAENPFLKQRGIDPAKLHVMFLSEPPAPAALKELVEVTVAPDQCQCSAREIYFYLPNGVSKSVLWNSPVDLILAVVTTPRNRRTVNTLHRMCQDCR